ncbi:MAG: hypothetical protein JO165_07070 [Candidatus Eremiobacteraeota bacterium]|nr:hypothetical protein [Candidatus Eremiobacteraeota bacterium]
MLAVAASRGWNYQGTLKGSAVTISIYADPSQIDAATPLVIAGMYGSVPTVLTDAGTVESNLIGRLGVTQSSAGDQAVWAEPSGTSTPMSIPGAPFLVVPNSLTLNQTWSADGGTATVVAVGTMPGASACPTSTAGAQVRYQYGTTTVSIAYVPGCGVTQVIDGNGEAFTLVSTGSYTALGQLAWQRHPESRIRF